MFLYVLLACFVVFIFKPAYLYSIIFVLTPPAVYNFLLLKKSKLKVFIFSLLSTLIFAPPLELMARLENSWDVQSVLPRFLGLVPLENMLFAFINIFWVLCFYEAFVDGDKKTPISRKFKLIVLLYFLFATLTYLLFSYRRDLVAFSYIEIGVPMLLFAVIIFYKNPHLISKVFAPTLFFSVVFFIYELVSLEVGSWWWPGEYLLPMTINGNIFPLDDVLIWYFLSTPVLIGSYEFFVDDWW